MLPIDDEELESLSQHLMVMADRALPSEQNTCLEQANILDKRHNRPSHREDSLQFVDRQLIDTVRKL